MQRKARNHSWQMGWKIGLLLTLTLIMHGCAGKTPVEQPTAPAPDSRPGQESVSVPKEGKAAATLLASARQNLQAGQFSQAEMMLERALRLEPRNARLWHEMGQVKYGQKDYKQVVQFCIKSKSLAGKDHALIRQNWLLMEKAYLQLGETEKARQARSKAG
ncbi:MAG: tetratricopeptide repeat protein [Proteobacteria bacterium]|nr:tetratricopeptide repeat protein [Pseudomonadota bacterium]